MIESARTLLEHLVPKKQLESEGMRDTPERMVSALQELCAGYAQDPAEVLGCTFPGDGYDEIVVVRGIPFVSLCEHHCLEFTGHVAIAYLPSDRIVGLSKLPRLVHVFARRLQVQERMTKQIADAIETTLKPQGLVVRIEGEHSCMRLRGVRSDGVMATQAVRGVFRKEAAARAEVLALMTTPG